MADEGGTKDEAAGPAQARPDPDKTAASSDPGQAGPERPVSGAQGAPPPIDFTTFIFSLSSSALIQLGEIPDPFTQKVEKNLTAGR